MSEPQITWSGTTPADIAAKLKAHPFAAEREAVMTKITLLLLGNAQKQTPVKTGTLRRSEVTHVDAGGLRGLVGTNLVYAPFAHARVPFFQLAIDEGRSQVNKLMADAGEKYFKDAV